MSQRYSIIEADAEAGVVTIEIAVGRGKTAHRYGVNVAGCVSQDEILERCQHTADEALGNLREAAIDESLLKLEELQALKG